MKVVCSDCHENLEEKNYLDFTIGKIYPILGILYRSDGRPIMLTLQRDSDGTPVLMEMKFFQFVDHSVPDGWGFFDFGNGSYSLEPQEFSGDFWDLYHDADPNAEAIFEKVLKKIEDFHKNRN
ncbi:hypothetical protein [Granulibacter bethesdensis]|uniref:hypothetical protein n=1 Tax=Granulibacter bethesdensis TaxID=364410 RepID=UPI00090A9C65|nr:hypothetical protein [Granulibacter bethesdensis]APG31155.1 hypothetical protein GbCGDNIH4_8219 [Granulibacter bethesdensis CGDNIH4]